MAKQDVTFEAALKQLESARTSLTLQRLIEAIEI